MYVWVGIRYLLKSSLLFIPQDESQRDLSIVDHLQLSFNDTPQNESFKKNAFILYSILNQIRVL